MGFGVLDADHTVADALGRRTSQAEYILGELSLRLEREGDYEGAARIGAALAALISKDIERAHYFAATSGALDPLTLSVLDGLSEARENRLSCGDKFP